MCIVRPINAPRVCLVLLSSAIPPAPRPLSSSPSTSFYTVRGKGHMYFPVTTFFPWKWITTWTFRPQSVMSEVWSIISEVRDKIFLKATTCSPARGLASSVWWLRLWISASRLVCFSLITCFLCPFSEAAVFSTRLTQVSWLLRSVRVSAPQKIRISYYLSAQELPI